MQKQRDDEMYAMLGLVLVSLLSICVCLYLAKVVLAAMGWRRQRNERLEYEKEMKA